MSNTLITGPTRARRRNRQRALYFSALAALGIASSLFGCSDDGGDGDEPGSSGGFGNMPMLGGGGSSASGNGGNGGGSASGSSSGNTGGGSNSLCPETIGTDGCAGEVYAGEVLPLDIYIMFDQSGSMVTPAGDGSTRLDEVRTAVAAFLNDPKSTGMGVGIGYFGDNQIVPDPGKEEGFVPEPASCDPSDYEAPDVGVDLLPAHAGAVMDSLNAIEPMGETPTPAAIAGACTYAAAARADRPGRGIAILLVTDGEPKAPLTSATDPSCNPDVAQASTAAADCLSETGIRTYVLGVGPSLDNLNHIASAGGTERAYLAGDTSASVLDALNQIRGAASIPCDLEIPDASSGALDFAEVNIVVTDAACVQHTLYYVTEASGCTEDGGWYYDVPPEQGTPSSIKLCEPSCEMVGVPGAQLFYQIGCAQVVR